MEDLFKTCCLDTVYIVKTNVGSYREVATEGGSETPLRSEERRGVSE